MYNLRGLWRHNLSRLLEIMEPNRGDTSKLLLALALLLVLHLILWVSLDQVKRIGL